jgi:RNA polymerase sigma factor (sigma-70 family)
MRRPRCNAGPPVGRRRGVTDLELSDSETPVLEETYRELRLPLLRLAFLLTGSRETAEDVVQGAFASAQPRWHRIDDPPAYLRRTVVNLAKDGQRREFRRRRLLRPEPEPVTAIPEIDETWALVRQLPVTQRAVVVLHYYEDLPLVEISHLLDRPASTVRSDLRRALDRLRKALP